MPHNGATQLSLVKSHVIVNSPLVSGMNQHNENYALRQIKDVLGFVPNSTDHNTVRDSVIYWLKKEISSPKS